MRAIASCLCLALTRCATGYSPSGFMGGYDETQLNPNVYRVSFKGNAYTSMDRAADFTLLRSAELALEQGYQYFIIVDENQWAKNETYTTPTQTTTTANVYGYGNTATGTAHSTTTGGQTYNYAKPRATNTIVLLESKDGVSGLVYDAQFIVSSMREKYGIQPTAAQD